MSATHCMILKRVSHYIHYSNSSWTVACIIYFLFWIILQHPSTKEYKDSIYFLIFSLAVLLQCVKDLHQVQDRKEQLKNRSPLPCFNECILKCTVYLSLFKNQFMSIGCWGPALADPGYSKQGRCRRGSGYNSFN